MARFGKLKLRLLHGAWLDSGGYRQLWPACHPTRGRQGMTLNRQERRRVRGAGIPLRPDDLDKSKEAIARKGWVPA